MLFPKKVKFRKWQTGRTNPKKKRVATRGTILSFGSHGLKATTLGRITSNQIESARRAATHLLGKTGRVWVRIFPDRPETQKGAELPMGKGKGDPVRFVAQVEPGRVLFEIDGVEDTVAREALRKAGTKLSVKTLIVTRY
ncbi:50S ribosomal protein L16 [Candidatus Kaiserbacteria bacterium]|nr:50S ribosomal protein L16 [Candidatus Kaiserbacteria bacterium]